MPPRKKVVIGILTSVGENHWSEPSIDHVSMHSGGVESLGGITHRETKGIMAAIEDLQYSQAAICAEFQSLRQETTVS